MIVEHCPICGGVISETLLLCNPPIHKKECSRCNRSWEKQEKEEHVVFNPNDWRASYD